MLTFKYLFIACICKCSIIFNEGKIHWISDGFCMDKGFGSFSMPQSYRILSG